MPPRLISTTEVACHASSDDCWLAIDNQVWDVTAFAPHHPGGADSMFSTMFGYYHTRLLLTAEVIVRYAGRDATAAYNEVHSPTTIIKALSPTQLIGQLDPSSISDKWGDNSASPAQTQDAKPPLNAVLSTYDFEDAARDSLSKKAWAFYSSAATDLISHMSNQSLFRRIWMRPRLLQNVRTVSTKTTVLGATFNLPVIAAPVALGRLADASGEKGIACAVAKKGAGYCV